LMNKETWLLGYGLGSAFLLELYIDFGKYITLFLMTIVLVSYKFYESKIKFSNGFLSSLIYINLLQYLLFLPRGSLSNFFPTLIFILLFYSFITVSSFVLSYMNNNINQHHDKKHVL